MSEWEYKLDKMKSLADSCEYTLIPINCMQQETFVLAHKDRVTTIAIRWEDGKIPQIVSAKGLNEALGEMLRKLVTWLIKANYFHEELKNCVH